MTPAGNRLFTLEHLENRKGESVKAAPGNGHIVRIPMPMDVDMDHALIMRNLSNAPG